MIFASQRHSQKIVMMGMSCVGKTSFSRVLSSEYGHKYHSFDHNFQYNCLTFLGYNQHVNWVKIIEECQEDSWVLDNWTTEDDLGSLAACYDATIYVLYDSHKGILDRYRVPLSGPDAYYGMYERMYRKIEFERYKVPVRFFWSANGDYKESSLDKFRYFIKICGSRDESRKFNSETWSWT